MQLKITKFLLFWGYFGLIFLVRRIWLVPEAIWLLVGVFLGSQLKILDQLVFVFLTYPNEPLSILIKQKILPTQESSMLGKTGKEKKIKEIWKILVSQVDKPKSVFLSCVFQVGWLGLALFTITSTQGIFGKGLVMAIGLNLLLEEWGDWITKKDLSWLFWQIKRPVSIQEQKMFLWIMTGMFGILSLFLI